MTFKTLSNLTPNERKARNIVLKFLKQHKLSKAQKQAKKLKMKELKKIIKRNIII